MFYKLTSQKMQTYGGFQWEPDAWYSSIDAIFKDSQRSLGSEAWFHCCDNPIVAIMQNPVEGQIIDPRLFRCNVKGSKRGEMGLKFGFTYMRLGEELECPKITLNQLLAFGILCVKEICKEKGWLEWADKWLSGVDRSKESATAAFLAGHRGSVARHVAIDAARIASCSAVIRRSCSSSDYQVTFEKRYCGSNAYLAALEADYILPFAKLAKQAMNY